MACIFGVDIVKGSLQGKIKPRYAVFILDDGKEIEKFGVSRSKLFRMIREYRPSIVSVDNIFELFKSKEELVEFLKGIPPTTKLVQVSGFSTGSLHSLSKRYGLKINIRSPMDEAKACAYLARLGVGEEVSVFIDKTIITVSRNRSLGKGGWRQNKYRRKVHDTVRQIFKEIKNRLDELGLEYVEDVREAYGGISRGTLLVNAPKERIPINSFKTRDVQVRVEAVEKDKIEFVPLKKSKPYAIVGVDPGTTTAVAVLDLNGNILGVRSKKGWNPSEVVEYILSLGRPVVIATDKSNPPEFVLKLRASFQAVLHTPKEDMSVERKRSLTSKFTFLNDHERDAIAAAMDAYNSYRNKLRNVEKRIPAGMDVDAVKAEIIRGTPLKDIIAGEEAKEKKDVKPSQSAEEIRVLKDDVAKKDKIIRELEEENRLLKKEIKSLKDEIERLRARILSLSREEHERVRRENYIKSLQAEIAELRKELKKRDEIIEELERRVEALKRMKYLEFSGWKSIKVLKKFTRDEIERLEKTFGINEGDVLYIEDSSGGGKVTAEYLCEKKIKAIITKNEMSHLAKTVFEEKGIPVIDIDEVEIEVGEDLAIINSEMFERMYRQKLEEMKKKKIEKLEMMFLEYRNRRSLL
jgi:predicted RNase H-like nuclease (RuvC/YqgF family)